MTSHQDIESLITDIDRFLPRAGSRFPWSKPSDVVAGHRLLERLRSYLVSQLQSLEAAPQKPTVATSRDTVAQQSTPEVRQIVQAVTQEMSFLRAELIERLQVELDAFREQRDSLLREIQQLEQTKQQIEIQHQLQLSQQQINSEFSQALISRCSENLRQQLAQIFANWEARLNNLHNTELISRENAPEIGLSSQFHENAYSENIFEKLQQRQIDSDKLLATLDANQRAIFEALQQNLQSYQKSLSQGLENMYSLGSQGQMLLAELVSRLGQQLGREASTILSSSVQFPELLTPTKEIAGTQEILDISEKPSNLRVNQQLPAFPYAGAEMPLQLPQPVDPLLEELENAANDAIEQWEAQSEAITQENSSENLDSEWEIIEGLDLEDLEVELEGNFGRDTFIQVDFKSQASLPSIKEIETSEQSSTQDINPSSDLVGEYLSASPPSELAQTQTDEVASLDKQEVEDKENFSSQEHLQEIEQLYEALFGKESVDNRAMPWTSDSLKSVSEGENSSSLEDKQQSQQENLKESESIKSIRTLTDLFEEMGLSKNTSAAIDSEVSISTSKEQFLTDKNFELKAQGSLNQEGYMPASPEENLLATEELELEANLDILLDSNTLQQLSQDLDNFEESETQDVQTSEAQSLSSNDSKSSTGVSSETPEFQCPQPLPLGMSEELLAEDWEEFALNDFSDQDFTLPEPIEHQIDGKSEEHSTSTESNSAQPEAEEQN
ncbi:MAG: hypothetical protein F6K36_01140 [Symploca sp. SIO3C6]|nr:hypothetical protein [Symploca sp. SIO3C6]